MKTQNLHSVPSHATKGLPITNSKEFISYQQERVGNIFSKKMMVKMREDEVPLS
jgi:hypothetical protein